MSLFSLFQGTVATVVQVLSPGAKAKPALGPSSSLREAAAAPAAAAPAAAAHAAAASEKSSLAAQGDESATAGGTPAGARAAPPPPRALGASSSSAAPPEDEAPRHASASSSSSSASSSAVARRERSGSSGGGGGAAGDAPRASHVRQRRKRALTRLLAGLLALGETAPRSGRAARDKRILAAHRYSRGKAAYALRLATANAAKDLAASLPEGTSLKRFLDDAAAGKHDLALESIFRSDPVLDYEDVDDDAVTAAAFGTRRVQIVVAVVFQLAGVTHPRSMTSTIEDALSLIHI